MEELLSTEEAFVNDLKLVVEVHDVIIDYILYYNLSSS